jgi:hypothetical protein
LIRGQFGVAVGGLAAMMSWKLPSVPLSDVVVSVVFEETPRPIAAAPSFFTGFCPSVSGVLDVSGVLEVSA